VDYSAVSNIVGKEINVRRTAPLSFLRYRPTGWDKKWGHRLMTCEIETDF